jgi:hypothetical protein
MQVRENAVPTQAVVHDGKPCVTLCDPVRSDAQLSSPCGSGRRDWIARTDNNLESVT